MITGQGRFDETEGGEAQKAAQMPLLKDPDQRAVRRQDRQPVHQDRLQRQEHRAEQHQQYEIGRRDHERDRLREVGIHLGDDVDDLCRTPIHEQSQAVGFYRPQLRQQRLVPLVIGQVAGVRQDDGRVVVGETFGAGIDSETVETTLQGRHPNRLLLRQSRRNDALDPGDTGIVGQPSADIVDRPEMLVAEDVTRSIGLEDDQKRGKSPRGRTRRPECRRPVARAGPGGGWWRLAMRYSPAGMACRGVGAGSASG